MATFIPTRGYGIGGSTSEIVTRGYGVGVAERPRPARQRPEAPPIRLLPEVHDVLVLSFDGAVRAVAVAGPTFAIDRMPTRELARPSVVGLPIAEVVAPPVERGVGERRYSMEFGLPRMQEIAEELAVRGDPRMLAAIRGWKRAR